MKHILLISFCIGLAACSSTVPQSYVFDEPHASDLRSIPDGQGGQMLVAERCINVTQHTHVRTARRFGAGCQFSTLAH